MFYHNFDVQNSFERHIQGSISETTNIVEKIFLTQGAKMILKNIQNTRKCIAMEALEFLITFVHHSLEYGESMSSLEMRPSLSNSNKRQNTFWS